jgi:hypothetical protein
VGTGNTFVVEDDTNPDSTPFVVAADGRVGIGITSPLSTYKLHVRNGAATNSVAAAGTIVAIESSGTTYLTLLSPDANTNGITYGSNTDRFGAYTTWNYSNNDFRISTAKTGGFIRFQTDEQVEQMRIDSSGNVGIGTISPSARLDVQLTGGTIGVRISGDSSSDMLRVTQTGSGNAIIVEDSANPDSTPFVVDATGRVGIGTTSPQYFLVASSSTATDTVMFFDGGTAANSNLVAAADTTIKLPVMVLTDRNNAYGVSTSYYIALDRTTTPLFAGRNDAIYVNNYQDKGHYFVTNNGGTKATRMSILSTGNVGIGTTSPSEKLHVSGNTLISGTLTVNGNISSTGTTTLGNGTFTKSGFATGDVLLDNNSTDTPGVLFYYANNSNYGIDSWSGSFDVLSGQLVRITNNLNETGGAVKMAIDTTGNVVVTGFIKANAWRAGQVVNDIMLSNTEVTVSTTTIATSTSDTDFVTYSYTPLSSSSYLVIHYHLADYRFESGSGSDSYFSRIKVDGNEITYSRQSTRSADTFRTGVLFPLTGRYTNSNTTAKSIVVACRRDSADDSITIVNTATSMWLRITEIAR